VVDDKNKPSENVKVDSLFKVKASKNVLEGYDETLRLQCKLKNEIFSIFSKEFNVIQENNKEIEEEEKEENSDEEELKEEE
jgi:hypothetical protein